VTPRQGGYHRASLDSGSVDSSQLHVGRHAKTGQNLLQEAQTADHPGHPGSDLDVDALVWRHGGCRRHIAAVTQILGTSDLDQIRPNRAWSKFVEDFLV
jgi:hypothetical protein